MIENLKDLEKLFKLCRKQGVQELKLGTVEFKLGDMPVAITAAQPGLESEPSNPLEGFPDGVLTPEQLMFYSSGGRPEDDPEREETTQ